MNPADGIDGWHDVRRALPEPGRAVWGYRAYRAFPPTKLGMLVMIGSRFYSVVRDGITRRHLPTPQPTLWKYVGGTFGKE